MNDEFIVNIVYLNKYYQEQIRLSSGICIGVNICENYNAQTNTDYIHKVCDNHDTFNPPHTHKILQNIHITHNSSFITHNLYLISL